MGDVTAWFGILFGIVAGAAAILLQWMHIPHRWRSTGIGSFRQRPLFARILYLIGIELLCLASLLSGIAKLQGAYWWWCSLLVVAGVVIVIWSLLGGPQRLMRRRGAPSR